ncbi:hybrid sensor histidine kinase/response regulator [Aeromonas schubertii]|nr:hybrid sensor histidine kinase/response regulator [Aeromonas schubertii]
MTGISRATGLRPRLMLVFFLLGMVPFLAVSMLFLHSHGKDLTEQTSNHLVSARNIKKSQLEDYFGNLKEQIVTFARQDFAGNSIGRFYGFTGAFEKLGTTPEAARQRAAQRYQAGSWDKLQKPDPELPALPEISALILADEMYGRVHQRFHRGYADIVRSSHYSDIYLVDLSGDVVYSVTKRPNFATNLLSGPYQTSALASTFRRVKRSLDGGLSPQQIFEFSDFGLNPLSGEVVAYLAAPVMQYDYVRGVVIFELRTDKISEIMGEREGLGETGETILVGPDRRMRADAWLDPRYSVAQSFSPAARPMNTPLVERTLAGEQGVGLFTSYLGDEVLAAYTPVRVFGSEWALIAEISTREAYARIRQLETFTITLALGSIILAIFLSRWLSGTITAPLRELAQAAERVANGDLDHPISPPRGDDEIATLSRAFAHMQSSLREKLALIARQTEALQEQVELTHHQNLSLQQADRLKDELLANTSHELRTPIHGIRGMAEAMLTRQDALSERQQDQLNLIIKSADSLARLVDDLLDYHRMRHGQLDIHTTPVSSKGVIRLVLDLCHHLVQAKPLRLVDLTPADLPAVMADEQRLEQVLWNLVGNAIKYTPEGKVVLSAAIEGDRLRFRITDTGIGIGQEHLEHIFEPLVQLEGVKQGSGLGLTITRQLVQLMGGSLEVTSERDVGSTFSFTLPLARAGASPATPDARPMEHQLLRHQPAPLPDYEAAPLPEDAPCLLVVDDEPINLHILQHLLAPCGYRILTSGDGHDALRRLEEEPVDLLLLDVMMPTLSGFDVCRRLREQIPRDRLPVLLLTALGAPKDIEEGFSAGANDYLVKPFAREELLARVNALLDAKRGRDTLVENDLLKREVERRLSLQQALQEDQRQLLSLLTQGRDPLLFVNPDGIVLFASRAASELLGLPDTLPDPLPLGELLVTPVPELEEGEQTLTLSLAGQATPVTAHLVATRFQGQEAFALCLLPQETATPERVLALENALRTLSRQAIIEDPHLLGELSRLGGEFRTLADTLIRQQDDDPLRRTLVDTMQLSLEAWQSATGKGKVALAEKSKLWRVYLDKSSPQTRTLDKYLHLDTLPQTPRWKTVVATAEYVLHHCPLDEASRQRLHQCSQELRQLAGRRP